ncbi:MAG: hypothetical protein ABSA83_17790 [Verrucomicrobiota bacterium]
MEYFEQTKTLEQAKRSQRCTLGPISSRSVSKSLWMTPRAPSFLDDRLINQSGQIAMGTRFSWVIFPNGKATRLDLLWELCPVFGLELGNIGSTPGLMMMDSPINEGGVKSNVPTGFFALDPLMTEYFPSTWVKSTIAPAVPEIWQPSKPRRAG